MNQRRHFLAGLIGTGFVAASGSAEARRPTRALDVRRLAVQFSHTGAWFRGPFKTGNEFDQGALQEFSSVVLDYRTGEVKQFDPSVLDLLWRVGNAVGVNQFTCVSGYRSPATNSLVGGATDSQHIAARALDIWLPAPKLGEAVEQAVAMRAGGVGAYGTWVHLDTGPVRFWDRRRNGEGGEGVERDPAITSVAARPGARPNPRFGTLEGLPPAPTPINTNTGLGRGRRMVIMEPLELQNSGLIRLPPLRVYNVGQR